MLPRLPLPLVLPFRSPFLKRSLSIPPVNTDIQGEEDDEVELGEAGKRKRMPFYKLMRNYIPLLKLPDQVHSTMSTLTKDIRNQGGRDRAFEILGMFKNHEEAYRIRKAEERAHAKSETALKAKPLGSLSVTYNEEVALAYTLKRFYESYATVLNVLSQVRKRLPGFQPSSVFDFGSGPGTGLWAAKKVWPDLNRAVACEVSDPMIKIATEFSKVSDFSYPHLTFQNYLAHPTVVPNDQQHDIVMSAFVLCDLQNSAERKRVVESLWNATSDNGVLVLIEKGNDIGFDYILEARSTILDIHKSSNTVPHLVAPCPHSLKCPLADEKKTCHFIQTIEYPAYLQLKGPAGHGTQRSATGSFVVFSKTPKPTSKVNEFPEDLSVEEAANEAYRWSRILETPGKKKGHTILDVCTPKGTFERWLTSNRAGSGPYPTKKAYRDSRKAHMGDLWPHDSRVQLDKMVLRMQSRNDLLSKK